MRWFIIYPLKSKNQTKPKIELLDRVDFTDLWTLPVKRHPKQGTVIGATVFPLEPWQLNRY